jgi:hypothetical protein
VVIGVGTATAYEVTDQVNPTDVWVDNGQRFCSSTRATTSHGNQDKGFSRGTTYSTTGSPCGLAVWKVAGNIKVKFQYWKQANDSGSWFECWGSGWILSTQTDWALSRYIDFTGVQPCGPGVYETRAWGGVKYNGGWRGENVAVGSGHHEI